MGCEFSDRTREFQRGMVKELHDRLPEHTKRLFLIAYGDIEKIPEKEIYRAYYHCKKELQRLARK